MRTIILTGLNSTQHVAAQVNHAFRSADRVIIIDPGDTADLAARAGAITIGVDHGLPAGLAEHIALSIALETGGQIILPKPMYNGS